MHYLDKNIKAPSSGYALAYQTVDTIDSSGLSALSASRSWVLRSLAQEGYATIEINPICIDEALLDSSSQLCESVRSEVVSYVIACILKDCNLHALLRELHNILPFDAVDLIKTSSYEDQGSDFWHRDGCGNRMKLFIPVYIKGDVPPTELFPASHRGSIWPMEWELLRCGLRGPHQQASQRLIEEFY